MAQDSKYPIGSQVYKGEEAGTVVDETTAFGAVILRVCMNGGKIIVDRQDYFSDVRGTILPKV